MTAGRGLNHPKITRKVRNEVVRLGHEFQGYREGSGYTQASFAEAADISLSMVTKIENGDKTPSLAMFVYVLGVLGYRLKIEEIR